MNKQCHVYVLLALVVCIMHNINCTNQIITKEFDSNYPHNIYGQAVPYIESESNYCRNWQKFESNYCQKRQYLDLFEANQIIAENGKNLSQIIAKNGNIWTCLKQIKLLPKMTKI